MRSVYQYFTRAEWISVSLSVQESKMSAWLRMCVILTVGDSASHLSLSLEPFPLLQGCRGHFLTLPHPVLIFKLNPRLVFGSRSMMCVSDSAERDCCQNTFVNLLGSVAVCRRELQILSRSSSHVWSTATHTHPHTHLYHTVIRFLSFSP